MHAAKCNVSDALERSQVPCSMPQMPDCRQAGGGSQGAGRLQEKLAVCTDASTAASSHHIRQFNLATLGLHCRAALQMVGKGH